MLRDGPDRASRGSHHRFFSRPWRFFRLAAGVAVAVDSVGGVVGLAGGVVAFATGGGITADLGVAADGAAVTAGAILRAGGGFTAGRAVATGA